ncbi:MAG: PAS domain S-box-containing protein [Desulforhopalus sp.]
MKSDREIQEMIKEALRPMLFNKGRGYFFIYDLEGNNILLPFSPHLEGKNLWNLKDSKGDYNIQKTAKMIREKGEGFQRWHWYKPGDEKKMYEKIGFSKHFEPYDWWIGTGEYIEDFQRDVQQETLEWINTVRFGQDGYIFVYDFNGKILAHYMTETIGKNVLQDTADQYGVEIVGELIRISQRDGGGFLEYVGKIRPSTGLGASKIGHTQSVKDWEWTVGAGVYVDSINAAIEVERKNLIGQIIKNILFSMTLLVFLLIILGFILRYLSAKTTDHIAVFTRFFQQASTQSISIDDDAVYFSEFKLLAHSANQMVDARKKVDEELKGLRNYLSNIIDSMPSVLIGVDSEGKVTQWNKTAEKNTGVSAETAYGEALPKVFPEMSDQMETIKQAITEKKIRRIFRNPHPGEKGMHYEDMTFYPLISNGVEGAVIRIDDVTKEYELEMEVRHGHKMDAIGQLAGGVAHDFNNMLAGINGASELLEIKLAENASAMKYIDIIKNATERAAGLTRKLLAFSRKGSHISTAVNLNEIINDVVAILERSIDKRIIITTALNARETMVSGDPSQLQSGILNLCVNARDAMPDGGELHITTSNTDFDEEYCRVDQNLTPGNYIQVSIADTGIGIPAEVQTRIFEPFYTTKDVGKGTGLGLAAVYGMVKDHRGDIRLYSEVGKGTIFHLCIPVDSEAAFSVPERKLDVVRGQGTILVIDDEEIIRATSSLLVENMGYTVLQAKNGLEGVNIYKEKWKTIDLVILDMVMPVMNGREAFQEILTINPEAKVIMVSGFARNVDMANMVGKGLAGFIMKPFNRVELSKLIFEIRQCSG